MTTGFFLDLVLSLSLSFILGFSYLRQCYYECTSL